MATQDRRSGSERRGTNRYPVQMEVEWQGSKGARSPGSMSDVSFDGCFILSSGDVEDGEPVRVFIPLADGMKVEFGGRVANHVFEIGFGVKFDKLSAAKQPVDAGCQGIGQRIIIAKPALEQGLTTDVARAVLRVTPMHTRRLVH